MPLARFVFLSPLLLCIACSPISDEPDPADPCPASTAEQARGRVFVDQDGDGAFGEGELGLAGVLVSNQFDVVKTDERGCYALDAAEEMRIVVTQPAGYRVPVSDRHLPLFHAVFQPPGGPAVAASSIHFALREAAATPSFTMVAYGDPQPETMAEIGYIRDGVAPQLKSTGADFALVLGDIMFDDLSLMDPYVDAMQGADMPLWHVAGNHDYDLPAVEDGEVTLSTYGATFGPSYYSFEYGQVHFVVLDTLEWASASGDERGYYTGRVDERQLRWLANDLQHVPADRLVVLASHVPLKSMDNQAKTRIENYARVLDVMAGREHLLALAGHLHTIEHHYLDGDDGWSGAQPLHVHNCAAASGAWWSGPPDNHGIPRADMTDGAPRGWHLYSFDGNRASEAFIPATLSRGTGMRISSPTGTLTHRELLEAGLAVNVFNGGPRTQVQVTIDGGEPLELTRTEIIDPYMERTLQRDKEHWKHWVELTPSTHLWVGDVPRDLTAGDHILVVRASEPGRDDQGLQSSFTLR